MGKLKGSPTIVHAGGINGFSSYAMRLPDQKVYVAILSNSESGLAAPGIVANRAAAIAVGKPFPDFKPIALDARDLDAFVGSYGVDEKPGHLTIVRKGDRLFVQQAGHDGVALTPRTPTAFFIADTLTEIHFGRNAQGEVRNLTLSDPGQETLHPRTRSATPAVRGTVQVTPDVFDRYVGKYALAPNYLLEVMRDGERYFAKANAETPVEIFPLSESMFFAKTVDVKVRFVRDANGAVTHLLLLQGDRQMPGKRL